MTDNNLASQALTQPDIDPISGQTVRQAVEAATQAEQLRDSLCVSSSPGQCFILSFGRDLDIQPHVLLHAL